MSRRRDRGAAGDERSRREAERAEREAARAERGAGREISAGWQPSQVAPYRQPARIPFLAQAGILVAVFAVTTLIAELAGAASLGVSLGIAAIAFSIALVLVILRT